MFFYITRHCILFLAYFTGLEFLSRMCQHMRLESSDNSQQFPTDFKGIWLYSNMDQYVILETGKSCKLFVTCACVNSFCLIYLIVFLQYDLFVLRLNLPVNNFSVMLGRSHRFLGN